MIVLPIFRHLFSSFSVRGVWIGVGKTSELGLVHWSQDILVDGCQLGFLDGESRVKVLDVQDVSLNKNRTKSIWKRQSHSFFSRYNSTTFNLIISARNNWKLTRTTLGLKGGSISLRSSLSQLMVLKKGWSTMSPAEQPDVPNRFWGSFSRSFYFIFFHYFNEGIKIHQKCVNQMLLNNLT